MDIAAAERARGEAALRKVSHMIVTAHLSLYVVTTVLVVMTAWRAVAASGANPVGAILAGLGFLAWFSAGAAPSLRTHSVRRLVWFAGLLAVWVVAIVVSREFMWLAFPLWLYAGHVLSLVPAIVVSVAVLAGVFAVPFMHTGQTNYALMIGPTVGGLFAVAVSRGYTELLADAREQQHLVRSLLEAHAELDDLQHELARSQRDAGAKAERTRISRDLHDTVAQSLSSISLLARGESGAEQLPRIDAIARESLVDVRRIVADLAPAELDDDVLAEALARMLDGLSSETHIVTTLHADKLPGLVMAQEVALLRCAQSALANVRQHADAKRVAVSLIDVTDGVRLDIVDDGRGFRPGQAGTPSSYGLVAMRDRLRALGGSLDVESAPNEGTAVSGYLPWKESAQ